MHRLYARYFQQHILWLKDGFRDYYVQPPSLRHWDIADVELKTIKDRERAILWLESCLAYEDFYNLIKLRNFLCEHSLCYVPVFRYNDRRVVFEVADMLRNNRYAIVVRPRFASASATIEPDAVFTHILGKKPGDVYDWGKGEFTENAARYAHPLTAGETADLAHCDLEPIDARTLTEDQAQEAARLFGHGPEARTLYANWRSRARIINHYKFHHPATKAGLMTYYRFARDLNPAWFAFERGWQLGTGKEMFTNEPVSRTQSALEFLLGIGVIKVFGTLMKAGRGAEAPEARPAKPPKGKGMPEPEPPTPEPAYEVHPDANPPKVGATTFKRLHTDGPANDPYTLMADGKPMGAEAGKMPARNAGLDDLPPNHDKYVKDGWPDLNNANKKTFETFIDAKPVELKPGTKIYRIVDENNIDSGGFWTYDLPKNKTQWRSGYAVKDSWNDNGYYVEHTVGPDGLKAWSGKSAGQRYRDSKFYLAGGEEQLFITPGSAAASPPKLTNWPEM
jgi:hypothetical protein